MELHITEKIIKNINTNIGWNNFDPDIKNGYKFKPPNSWYGLYINLYFKTPDNKIIATTDITLIDIYKIDEKFEKFYTENNGRIDKIKISEDFKILKYKTWSRGKTSEWINYL